MTGALDGIRILEIGDRGEQAGRLLADAGADVIRIEPVEGSYGRRQGPFVGDRPGSERSLHHAYMNANKRGITLDPSTGDGAELWRRLVEGADVVIDSYPPGFLDSIDCGPEVFAPLFIEGRLVWCAITPFGLTGPWKDWEATDLTSIALGGPMMSTGYDDHDLPPIRPDGEHSLWMAGEHAAMGILAALIEREQSGLGQLVDVSVHEAVSVTTEGAFPNWEYKQALVQRQTGRHVHSDPMQATVERARISEVIGAFIQTRPSEEVYRRGQSLHLPWAVIRPPEDNLSDPHWEARGFWAKTHIPEHDSEVRFPLGPYKMSATPLELRRRAPLLGEHNTEVYGGELGLEARQLWSGNHENKSVPSFRRSMRAAERLRATAGQPLLRPR